MRQLIACTNLPRLTPASLKQRTPPPVSNSREPENYFVLKEPHPIHFICKKALRLQNVFQSLGIVINASIQALTEGKERNGFGRGLGSNQVYQFPHGNSLPLRNAGPTLNTVMHRRKLGCFQSRQLRQRQLHR